MKLKIPPPIIFAVFGITVWLVGENWPVKVLDIPFSRTIGYSLIGFGFLIDIMAIVTFRRHKAQINPFRPEKSDKLVTTGVYRWSRNPMYLGLLVMLSGICVLRQSVSAFLLLPLFVLFINWLQILPEEKALGKNLRQAFDLYREQVRRWL